MKRTGVVLGLLSGLLVALAIIAAGDASLTAQAQPALQADGENCVTCHTDKAILQELAVEPEEEEELSEGEG
jgi:mono/diheme cytochrome c family protein